MCKINCSGGCPECDPKSHKLTPHKHAALIKAWADGAQIQFKGIHGTWITNPHPAWSEEGEYRIEPKPKSDIVYYYNYNAWCSASTRAAPENKGNLKLTFDGETGKLKAAEVV